MRDNLKLSKLCETFKGKTEGESEGRQRGVECGGPRRVHFTPPPPNFSGLPEDRRTVSGPALSSPVLFKVTDYLKESGF